MDIFNFCSREADSNNTGTITREQMIKVFVDNECMGK